MVGRVRRGNARAGAPEGVTKGSRPPIDESPFGPGRGDDGPVLIEKTSDIKPFDGFTDDVVDEVLETSLGRGLLGVRAADGR